MGIISLILLIIACGLFLMDAFKATAFNTINRSALGWALITLVMIIGGGVVALA